MDTIGFTQENVKPFITAYNAARKAGQPTFVFENKELVIDYAYYLIQYLQNRQMVNGSFNDKRIFTLGNHKLN